LLQTERLLLDPLEPSDAADLHASWSDPETLRHWHLVPSRSLQESRDRLGAMLERERSCEWAIRLAKDAPAIGHVGWIDARPGGRSPFGYLLHKDHWGRGYAALAALGHGFEELGVAGAELWIYQDNARSVRVAEKVGCSFRGRFVGFNVMRGEQIPTLVYGVTAREFGARSPAPDPVAFYDVHPVIEVCDVQAAVDFYCGRLGFQLDWSLGDPPGAASVSRIDWQPLGATIRFTLTPDEPSARPGWLSIGVDDVDRLHDEYLAAGVEISQPPTGQPWGLREMEIVDCHGQRLSFVTPVRSRVTRG
jgi:RimJ/RimL family protein N-acetyltransferase/catechol 2,3-dioxygenase-like lactoylglutathione lyase family enzyme